MSKRQTNGRFAKKRPPVIIGLIWAASFVSLGLLYLTGRMMLADFAAFRSCNGNSSGLQIVSCGKHGINFGDLVFLTLFALSAALVVSLFTASWRLTRRVAV